MTFDLNVRALHSQIQKLAVAGQEEVSGGEPSLKEDGLAPWSDSEAKEELERLRADLTPVAQSSAASMLAEPAEPATIPAGVPKLPARFQSTQQICELTELVLSTEAGDMAKSRVGFFGMGGIGKTVTGAAIARDSRIRQYFHIIVWLPLGQTPLIPKLQSLCHMQCTGRELSSELSLDEKKQALQQAMAGKRILLCLDDLWEEEHEPLFNFVDTDAGSKVLISTRVKGLLAGAHQVEVGLPSPADSAMMLIAAAGVDVQLGSQGARTGEALPTGVAEICVLCGRLPLALGIAGRLAANVGLVGAADWSDMISVLKEELRESHSGGTEEVSELSLLLPVRYTRYKVADRRETFVAGHDSSIAAWTQGLGRGTGKCAFVAEALCASARGRTLSTRSTVADVQCGTRTREGDHDAHSEMAAHLG